MVRFVRLGASIVALSLPATGLAQATRADPAAAAIAAADRAASAAERAADEAERAYRSAREAAMSARVAADEARRAMALPPAPRIDVGATTPPSDENLPVHPPGGDASRVLASRDEQRAFAAGLSGSVANGPNGAPLKASGVPDLQLVASSKDKVASLAWTLDISGRSRTGGLAVDQFTLTASSKLDDEGNAEVLGLDGFPNGTQVALAYTHFWSGVRLSGVEKDPVRVARERCLLQLGATPQGCDPYEFATGVGSFVARYNPQGLRPLLREVLPGRVSFAGARLSGDQSSQIYLDRNGFSLVKTRRFDVGAGVFGGVLLGSGRTALVGSFDYRRRFRENDPITLCQPLAGTVQTQCLTGADGPSAPDRRAVFGFEARHAFPVAVGSFSTFAVAPRLSVDVVNDAWSLDAPLYFAGDGAGRLRGGVRATYLNQRAKGGGREDDFLLGLFVGVPFTLFGE